MSKKFIVLFLVCSVIFLCACNKTNKGASGTKTGSTTTEAASKSTTTKATATQSTTTKAEVTQSTTTQAIVTQSTTTKAADSGMTLEKLKAEAKRLGQEVTDIVEIQMMSTPKPVAGFNVHYVDEYSDSFIPVYEFSSSADALVFAEDVNKSGYNLCVVNDRFLSFVSTQYGVVMNDAEAAFVTELLQSELMAFSKEAESPVITSASDYKGAAEQAGALKDALNTFVNNNVLTHDKTAPEDKNFSANFISFNLVSSVNLSFTSNLSEKQEDRDFVVQLWSMFGVKDMKADRTAPHTYELTGVRVGVPTPFLIRCEYDPSTGSLRLVEYDGDNIYELFEFVPLSGDTYAFQTKNERAILTYRDDKIISFTYSLLKSDEDKYAPDTNGIFKNNNLDEAWVTAAGEDHFEQQLFH